MTVYILFFIFHVIIYGPRVCNKHLNIIAFLTHRKVGWMRRQVEWTCRQVFAMTLRRNMLLYIFQCKI